MTSDGKLGLGTTNPLRKSFTIKRAFKKFLKSKNIDSLRAVEKCKQHPAKMWVLKKGIMFPLLKSKKTNVPMHSKQYQDLPEIYVQNASLEIAWTKVLYKKNPCYIDVGYFTFSAHSQLICEYVVNGY